MGIETKGTRSFVTQIAPQALTSSPADGADVDLQDANGATFMIQVGAWTDGTFTFEFEEADDDGTGSPDTYAAIADADLDTTEPVVSDATDDDSIIEVSYLGDARFVRITCVVTGSPTTGAEIGAFVERAHLRTQS